jgi:hypothetical protein
MWFILLCNKVVVRNNQGAGMGKEGFEPSRLAARDPKSRLSANSSTSPAGKIISVHEYAVKKRVKKSLCGGASD